MMNVEGGRKGWCCSERTVEREGKCFRRELGQRAEGDDFTEMTAGKGKGRASPRELGKVVGTSGADARKRWRSFSKVRLEAYRELYS